MPPQQSEHAQWFATEVQVHEPALRSYLRSLFPSLPDIDDIVQESYARLIRSKDAGRVGYAKAYLFATARNAALDFFRRKRIISIEPVADFADLPVLDDGVDVPETVSRRQELEILADAVRDLPDRCRQVLTLRLVNGLSQKEIATELGISGHTVKAQLAKGMRRCSEFFEARGMLKSASGPKGPTP